MAGFLQGIEAARAFVRIGVEDQVTAFLATLQSRLNRFGNQIGRLGSQLGSFGLGGTVFGGALLFGINSTINAASEATEVNTAYAATFRELTNDAEKFAEVLSRRLGRDIVQVKDIQRSFFGLFAGQGFAREFALSASNAFTQLSVDFSSFFNQSVEEASGRLLSALSNSAEVVQRFGFNVRAAALESAFTDLGIDKTIETASEQEKTLARALILLNTSSEAQLNIFGDVERTINEFANQRRRLISSLTVLQRALGKPLELALAPFLGSLAPIAEGLAEIVRQNPETVKQLSLMTLGITAGSGALILFGFALRVSAFSLAAFTRPLTAFAVAMIRLPDLIIRPAFEITRLAFAVGSTLFGALRLLIPVINTFNSVVNGLDIVVRFAANAILQFMLPAIGSLVAIIFNVIPQIYAFSSAIAVQAVSSLQAWLASLLAVNRALILTGTATAASGLSTITGAMVRATSVAGGLVVAVGGVGTGLVRATTGLARSVDDTIGALRVPISVFSTVARGFIEGPVEGTAAVNAYLAALRATRNAQLPRLVGSNLPALRNVVEGVFESAGDLSTSVLEEIIDVEFTVLESRSLTLRERLSSTLGGVSSRFAAARASIASSVAGMASAVRSGFSNMVSVIARAGQSIVGSLRNMATAAVTGFIPAMRQAGVVTLQLSRALLVASARAALSFAAVAAPAIGAVLLKLTLVAAVAGAIAGVFILFKDQIVGAFNAAIQVASQFASSARTAIAGFITDAIAFFGELWVFASERFFSLLAIGQQVFEGLRNAIEAGNLQLAFSIATTGMKVALYDFLTAFVTRWGDSIVDVVESLYFLRGVFQETFARITGFVRQAFREIAELGEATSDVIAGGITRTLEGIGAVPEGTSEALQEDIARRNENSKRATAAAIDAEVRQQITDIQTATAAAVGAVQGNFGAIQEGLAKGLEGARGELESLTAEAIKANEKQPLPELTAQLDFENLLKNQTGEMKKQVDLQNTLKAIGLFSTAGTDAIVGASNGIGVKDVGAKIDQTNNLISGLAPAIGEEFTETLDDVGVLGRTGIRKV
jgi:hypothetical protein